ncbi:helix-turn-helix transcriptional regulator [Actinomyces sp. MRS3W]|uniref:helix-turn-helix transcriptional regulator n=1 Tax=Actinomyces sp. MRS3W TaxID=2800796 RepID=UPI0028FD00F4|nr:LuxR C-terminal-related transcriptional regulator [Actinomyces sp. MRS3W]MDU0348256.1 LuxR C-terminal-related transcriptional regulator [Actinomyces sp. MRS3W]
MPAPDQRRLVAREIADRLRRGLGSFCLVAAPSVPGVWSLGPALAADVARFAPDAKIVEVDAAVGGAMLESRPELSADDVLLVTSITQVCERLGADQEFADLHAELASLCQGVQAATTAAERAEAVAEFAAAAACRRPILVAVSASVSGTEVSTAQMQQAASLLAAVPFAVIVLLPEGPVADAATPPFFSTSVWYLGADDARDLISAETATYVDPLVAGWISRSAAGRIADIRDQSAALSAAALAGRELPPRQPVASAQARRAVAERIHALAPEQRHALVSMHLQLVPDATIVQEATGATPPSGTEDLLPSTSSAPGLETALSVAVVETLPQDTVHHLHAALAEAYAAGTREWSWHRLGAGIASVEDRDRLLAAAGAELERGSLNIAWRIIDALHRSQTDRGVRAAQVARTRLLQGQLALQLGCTLTASSHLLEAIGGSGACPADELSITAGYIVARGCEGVSVSEDARLARRIAALGADAPVAAARCLILLAAQERLAGEERGPHEYLHAAINLLDAEAGAGAGAGADTLALARALLARVNGPCEGRAHSEAPRPADSLNDVSDIPADISRLEIAVWAEAVIRVYLAHDDAVGERPVGVEPVLSRLAEVSPFFEAQEVALRAFLTSRLGWTRYAREQLEDECYRVPLRVGLVGMGMAAGAQGAMLFGDAASAAAWRAAMAHALPGSAASLPGSAASPQQLWVSVLEATARLAAGDDSLAGLLLGPAVAAAVSRVRLRPVWSSVVDMAIVDPTLLERVPGLAGWFAAELDRRGCPDPDDRLLAVLLADDAEAVATMSALVLDTVFSGNVIWQVRANMACAARLRRSPQLEVADLGIAADAGASARVLVARAAELANLNGMWFWRTVTDRVARSQDAATATPPGSGAKPLRPLSDVELRVARLAAQGHRNKDIAGELYMAVRTVELRLTGVYRALGISSRKDLRRALADAGLLED